MVAATCPQRVTAFTIVSASEPESTTLNPSAR